MTVKSIENEKKTAKLVVEVEAAKFEAALNNAYLKNRKSIQLPGFRKGKAPRKMIEAMFGKEVFYEDAINDIFPEVYAEACKDLKVVGMPSVNDVSTDDAGNLTITFTTDLYPEVTLGEYKGLEVEKADAVVTDEEVEAELDHMAQNIASVETVDRAAELGDTAVIDYEGLRDGVAFDGGSAKGYELKLGSNTFIPGFEEKIVGMKAGEKRALDLTFPKEYHEASLAGKDVVFNVTLHEVKVTNVPAKDDEFAKEVSPDCDTLDELRASVREKLLKQKQDGIDRAFENAALEAAVKNMTVEIPNSMLEEQVDREMERFDYDLRAQGASLTQYAKMVGGSVETFRGYMRPAAESHLRANLLLNAVVAAENITVSDEEKEAEYNELASAYQMDVSRVKELLKEEDLTEDLATRKAAKLIAESAVAVAPKAEEKTEE